MVSTFSLLMSSVLTNICVQILGGVDGITNLLDVFYPEIFALNLFYFNPLSANYGGKDAHPTTKKCY